jgi:membrane protein implicated in regulation of membrane protease activity
MPQPDFSGRLKIAVLGIIMETMSFGDWWSALSGTEQVFWAIAIVASVLFVIQFVLSLLGIGDDFDHDHDFSGHADVDSSIDADFTVLSVRSMVAFFTFFGWTGVLALHSGASGLVAFISGSVAGLTAMFLVAYIIYFFTRLQESGNIDLNDAIFSTAEVYLTIPANKNGNGKIHLKIKGSFRELDAVTEGRSLPTGASVRILGVLEDNLLLVEPFEKQEI